MLKKRLAKTFNKICFIARSYAQSDCIRFIVLTYALPLSPHVDFEKITDKATQQQRKRYLDHAPIVLYALCGAAW